MLLFGIIMPVASAEQGANEPTIISGFTTEPMISAGRSYTLALKNNGTVWAWGINNVGQLGDGTRELRSTPVQVQNLNNVIAI